MYKIEFITWHEAINITKDEMVDYENFDIVTFDTKWNMHNWILINEDDLFEYWYVQT